jgi:hypothetical protein
VKHSWKIFVAIVLVLTQVKFTSAAVVTGTPGFSANDFANSVCMNVHMEYIGGTPYGNEPYIKALLQSLAVTCIRDSLQQTTVIAPMLNDLAASGIQADLNVATGEDASYINSRLNMLNSGVVNCLEGPNELNQSGNQNWFIDDLNEQRAMKQALQVANTTGICLIGPSTSNGFATSSYAPLGDLSSLVDYVPIHNYENACNPETTGGGICPPNSNGPYGIFGGYNFPSIPAAIANGQQASLSKPVISTENGYCTLPNFILCVNQQVQADYLLRMILQEFINGIPKTYVYDLADENENVFSTTYGLVQQNGPQKIALFALSGFRAILADTGASTPPCQVPISTTNGNVALMGLCFSSGASAVVYWNPAPEWNPTAMAQTTPSPVIFGFAPAPGFTPTTKVRWDMNETTGVYAATLNSSLSSLTAGTSPSIMMINGPATPSPLPSIPTPLPS